jgi:hypothetical protein
MTFALHTAILGLVSASNASFDGGGFPGYWQLSNDGFYGPCRGQTPDDNDRTAYGMVMVDGNWTGGNVLTTPIADCNFCADLCTRNVNITGHAPYDCVAFECTPAPSDFGIMPAGWTGSFEGGPRCELWSKVPLFAGATACVDINDATCASAASGCAPTYT